MTTTQHTPGPWAVDQHSLNIWQDSPAGYIIGRLKPLYNSTEHLANAKLIAAAPDMLLALYAAYFELSKAQMDTVAFKRVQAAINKADK